MANKQKIKTTAQKEAQRIRSQRNVDERRKRHLKENPNDKQAHKIAKDFSYKRWTS